MAAPSIRGQTAPVSGGTTTSPAGTQVGDLVIVYTWERVAGNIGASTLTHNSGASFEEIFNHHHNDGTTDGSLAVAYKVATQAGAQSYQGFTSSTGSPVWWTGCTVLQSGTYATAGIVSAGVTQTNNAVPNPPSVNLDSGRDYLVLAIAAWYLGSSLTNTATAPTNYTNLVQLAGAATGDLACSSRAVTGAASEDPGTYGDDQAPSGTCSITVAVANALPERTGTMAPTEGVDTASAAGDVIVQGTLSVTDGSDTAAIAGDVLVQGTAAPTEGSDTFAAEGDVTAAEGVSGTLEATDAADTAAASGGVLVQGTSAPTEAADTADASGTVLVAGTLSGTDARDTAAAAGEVLVSGTVSSTDAGDTVAVSGSVLVQGALDATETSDTASFSAGSVRTGTLETTEASDTGAALGAVVISGTWIVSEAGLDTANGTGSIMVAGALIGGDSPDIAELLGAVRVSGTLEMTETADTFAARAGEARDPQTPVVVSGAIRRVVRVEGPVNQRVVIAGRDW